MKITLEEIAQRLGGELAGDSGKIITSAAPFEKAGGNDITFADGAKFLKMLHDCKAGAIIVPDNYTGEDGNLIRVANPKVAFAQAMKLFYPLPQKSYGLDAPHFCGREFAGGEDLSIGPYAVIGDCVTVGDRVTIHPNVVLGDDVVVGDDVVLYPNVTILDRCRIGNRVVIHAGTVIGSDGFGFAPDGKQYHKIQQTGIVQIDDDVEIGAGNTIDRATFGKTRLCKGVKTDNLVHIAHNVTIGENSIVVAQAGIAGSTTVGQNVIIAGQTAVADHLEIGDNVIVAPRSGVAKSIPAGQVVSGTPTMPHRLWLKVQQVIPRLPEMHKKVAALARRIERIEKDLKE